MNKLKESKKNQNSITKFAEQLGVQIKVTILEDSSECRKKINKLKTELEQKNQELDILTTKQILLDQFNNVNNKDVILTDSILIGVLITCFANLPSMIRITSAINEIRTPLQVIVAVLAPFTVGTAIGTWFMKKRDKNLQKALTNLKSELLSNQELDSEKQIEDLINEISEIEFEMQNQIEMAKVIEANKKTVYEYTFDISKYKTEEYEPQECEIENQKGNQYTLRIPQKRL